MANVAAELVEVPYRRTFRGHCPITANAKVTPMVHPEGANARPVFKRLAARPWKSSRPSANPLLRHVVVAEGADAADNWIVDHIAARDICITADIPLAARCLDKGARVLLEPREGPAGWRSVVATPAAGELAFWQPKR